MFSPGISPVESILRPRTTTVMTPGVWKLTLTVSVELRKTLPWSWSIQLVETFDCFLMFLEKKYTRLRAVHDPKSYQIPSTVQIFLRILRSISRTDPQLSPLYKVMLQSFGWFASPHDNSSSVTQQGSRREPRLAASLPSLGGRTSSMGIMTVYNDKP